MLLITMSTMADEGITNTPHVKEIFLCYSMILFAE
jgi:hypothetical protein